MSTDGSVLVRKELLVFFSTFVKRHQNKFLVAAYDELQDEKKSLVNRLQIETGRSETSKNDQVSESKQHQLSRNTTFGALWKQVLIFSVDPHPDISRDAGAIVDFIHLALLESPMAMVADKTRIEILDLTYRLSQKLQLYERPEAKKTAPPSTPPSSTAASAKQEGYLSLGFRRTASVAASLKNLAFGSGSGEQGSDSSPPSSPTKSRMPITPRGRAPPEWTRPPEVNDQVAPATAYHHAPVPRSRGFEAKNPEVAPMIPLKSRFLDWSTEVIPNHQILICVSNLCLPIRSISASPR
jgi:regulator-associated protein of mTOR